MIRSSYRTERPPACPVSIELSERTSVVQAVEGRRPTRHRPAEDNPSWRRSQAGDLLRPLRRASDVRHFTVAKVLRICQTSTRAEGHRRLHVSHWKGEC